MKHGRSLNRISSKIQVNVCDSELLPAWTKGGCGFGSAPCIGCREPRNTSPSQTTDWLTHKKRVL